MFSKRRIFARDRQKPTDADPAGRPPDEPLHPSPPHRTPRLLDSHLGHAPMEGLVVRRESDGATTGRAKLVRPSFVQAISEHWSRGALRPNHLKDRE